MTYYCTLFDSVYISRGLLLYDSLKNQDISFHLYIFAFDQLTDKILRNLDLPDVTVISLTEFENEKILAVKSSRTKAEYCWTSASSTIDYVLEKFNVSSCTYLDADLYFYASPEILLNELNNGKNILITEHRFSKYARLFEQRRAGRFCVQFITFTNQPDSREVLDKWKNQCINWCYARYENGKFGDQKYLDHWPDKYPNVHILEHPGGGIAPWNVRQYKFRAGNGFVTGRKRCTKKEFKVVFFHFHFVRFLQKNLADLGWNRLPERVLELFYYPYLNMIEKKEKLLEADFIDYKRTLFIEDDHGFREKAKKNYKQITGFNIIKVPEK